MTKDAPWLFRTYAGHSTATASNALYRTNLAKGQTGLSVAFDLPTQTGYDSDHELARGEVGQAMRCVRQRFERRQRDAQECGQPLHVALEVGERVVLAGEHQQQFLLLHQDCIIAPS